MKQSLQEPLSPKAYLVSTYPLPMTKEMCDEHLHELAFLAETAGIDVVGRIACPLRKVDAALFLGKGKLVEIDEARLRVGADLIIFDDEITPSQQRNLESLFGTDVIDRTAVIIDVFQQRAQSKEARLQVELAKLKYEMPRLKRLWTHLSRQQATGGGGAYLKGEGRSRLRSIGGSSNEKSIS